MSACRDCGSPINPRRYICDTCLPTRRTAARNRTQSFAESMVITTVRLPSVADELLMEAEKVGCDARADEDPLKAVRLGRMAVCRYLNRAMGTDLFTAEMSENEIKVVVYQRMEGKK